MIRCSISLHFTRFNQLILHSFTGCFTLDVNNLPDSHSARLQHRFDSPRLQNLPGRQRCSEITFLRILCSALFFNELVTKSAYAIQQKKDLEKRCYSVDEYTFISLANHQES